VIQQLAGEALQFEQVEDVRFGHAISVIAGWSSSARISPISVRNSQNVRYGCDAATLRCQEGS
jgi:hypothetical protein